MRSKLIFSAVIATLPALSQVVVTTQHNDNFRSGLNAKEKILAPTNVSPKTFGKLFSYPVDGFVYAQPLYIPGVPIGGINHNVIYIATENDSVYAFDADSNAGTNANPLWHVNFTNPAAGVTPVVFWDVNSSDVIPYIGITSTPVIQVLTSTIYVVAKTAEVSGTTTSYVQRLHALDLKTGAEKFGGPVVIAPTYPGTDVPNDGNGKVIFDALHQHNRPGLLLSGGVLYAAWASHGDQDPYHGWLVGFNASTLQQVSVYNTTPNAIPGAAPSGRGGFWQGGSGLSADQTGSIYGVTGNGSFDGIANFGDSVLKFSSTLQVTDSFTPYDQAAISANDVDLGSSGAMLMPPQSGPTPHLLITASKNGSIYVINRDAMGGYNPNGNQIVQYLPGAIGAEFGSLSVGPGFVYFWGANDAIRAFPVNGGLLGAPILGPATAGYPGPHTSVSSNGTTNSIVWAIQTDQYVTNGPAALLAFAGANIAVKLYDSGINLTRDNPGPAVKFSVPTVVNGKVYVGTQNSVSVFGLLPLLNGPTIPN